MARASFGGGGDYSGFFSGMYNANKSAARAEQDAKDADMADRWENGLITDNEWMDYIRSRIDQETDPKRNERWVEALRKYGPAIADAQMVTKYEAGEITIGELITHYEGRLSGTVADSNEYREVTKILNDLKDSRASQNLSKKAEDLINDIEAGKASYDDLLKLYKEQLKSLRPNSDLYKQVEGQIEKVNDTIKGNKIEGELARNQYLYDTNKLSGSSYAAKIRELAANFKESDPARYWNLMRSAADIAKGGGSGGRRGGGSGSSGGSSSTATIDALQGERNRLQAIVEQIETGAKQGVDPATGRIVAFTPAYIKSIDTQLLSTFDSLEQAYRHKTDSKGRSKPDLSAAANTAKAKTSYIVDHAQKHNTLSADEQGRNILNATIKRFNAASELSDPEAAKGMVISAAKDFARWSDGLNKTVINNGEDDIRYGATLALADQVTPEYQGMNQSISQALMAIANGDEGAIQSALEILGDAGVPSNVITALTEPSLKVVARAEAVASGDMVQVYGSDGKMKWIETTNVSKMVPDPNNPGQMMTTVVKEADPAQLASEAGWDGGEQTKVVDMFVDMNGEPTKVKAVVVLTGTGQAYYTSKQVTINGIKVAAGTRLSNKQLEFLRKQLGKGPEESLLGYDGITVGNAVNYYQTTVNGQTWYQDPETKLWYKDALPLRNWELNPDGTWKMDDEGRPVVDWRSYASASGVPAIYVGTNNRAMQSIIDSIDPDQLSAVMGRDANGNLTPYDPNDLNSAYYDPINAYTGFNTDPDSWWNKDERKGREAKKYDRYTAEIRGKESGDISFKTISKGREKTADQTAIEALGRAFGISSEVGKKGRGYDPRKAQQPGGAARKPGPQVNDATGFVLPDPKMSTGPKVSGALTLPTVKGGVKANTPVKKKPLPKISAPKPPKVNRDDISSNEMAQQRVNQQRSGGPAGRV